MLEVSIPNKDRAWPPGETVLAELALERLESRLLLPRSAVQNVGASHYVFKVENQRARRHVVALAESDNDMVAIRAGVTVGEKIIVSPPEALKDGAPVRVTQGATPVASP
jgi:multidrug efflux system membrane fusion protein